MSLDFLTREQLEETVHRQAKAMREMRQFYLDGRSHEVIQAAADEVPESLFIDTDLDGSNLLDEYRKRQLNFDTAPFDPMGERFRLFPGGFSIWSGFPGTGKTTLLRQLVCHLMHKGRGVFVASLEEDPRDTMPRLMMTAFGNEHMNGDQAEWFLHEFRDRLKLWGQIGLAKYRTVFGAMRAAANMGCRHAIIDSMTCLDIGGSDWDGQRGLANELAALMRSTGMHGHLVAHPRKPMKHGAHPDISDISGSSDLGRLADNVIFVRRDPDSEPAVIDDATEMQIVVKKQRHGSGWCGNLHGYFHRKHKQFSLDKFWTGPIRYVREFSGG